MEILQKDGKLKNFEIKVKEQEGPKIDFPFQETGVEMQKVYGKPVWMLFYKYPLWKIQEAFKICQKRGNTSFAYLVGVIKKI